MQFALFIALLCHLIMDSQLTNAEEQRHFKNSEKLNSEEQLRTAFMIGVTLLGSSVLTVVLQMCSQLCT